MKPKALTRAAAITIAWIAIATIGSELSPAFKGLLSNIGGHHWIGKSVTSVVFFVVLYFLFSKAVDKEYALRDTWVLLLTGLVAGLAIFAFYVLHA